MQNQSHGRVTTHGQTKRHGGLVFLPSALMIVHFVFCGISAPHAQDKAKREYWVPGHGTLVLSVPISWREETRQPSGGFPPTITFRPEEGQDFVVRITALWGPKSEKDHNSAEKVRALLENDREGVAPNAVETELVVQSITGENAHGFYFVATDKAPRPGDPPYLIRADVATGELVLNVTVLSHQKDSEAIQEVLLMLQEARQQED
jgi:hypothetical protein